MIKILEISESFGIGGTEQAIQLRVENINKIFFECFIVAFNSGGPRLDELNRQNFETEICYGNSEQLDKIVGKIKPHIINYYRGKNISPLIKLIQNSSYKYGIPLLIETNHFGRLAGENSKRKADIIVHVSKSSFFKYSKNKKMNMKDLLNNNIVIYNPVPVSKFETYKVNNKNRLKIRRSFGFNDNDLVACRIARPDLRKWSPRLEFSLPFLFKEIPNLKFIFCSLPLEKRNILKAKYKDKVVLVDTVSSTEELSKIYQISDLMIHSSGIGESFGLSIAEAMYWQLPIVVDSTPKMDNAQIEIIDNGINGIIVNSTKGFVTAVKELSNDLIKGKTLGAKGKEKAIQYFADKKVTQQWEALFINSLIKKNISIITEEMKSYVNKIEKIPSISEYTGFENEYRVRLNNVDNTKDSLLDLTMYRLIKMKDLIFYIKKIGIFNSLSVLRERLSIGKLFNRS